MTFRAPAPRSAATALVLLLAVPLARAATAPAIPPATAGEGRSLEICATPPATPAAPGPHLYLEARSHDFGTVQKGAKLRHTFVVRNAGTQPLEISDVQVACGCTTAGEWTRRVAPGGTGTIPLELDSTQFTGPIVKTVTLTTNCVRRSEATLELKAIVRAAITISNSVVIFPALTDPSQAAVRSVTLRQESEGALQLTELASDKPAFKPSLKETVPGREFELTIATVPPLATGSHTGRITLKSSNPEMPLVAVQAVATVLPPVQIAPTSINFTDEPLTAPEKRYVVVLNHRGGDLHVSDLASSVRGLTFDPQRSADGRQITIGVTFPAGFDARAPGRHFITGRTSDPSTPTFEVPLVYVGPR